MRSKVTWLTAAAAVILMAAVVMWPGGGITSRAYAITELPQLMREARTLHMKGWTYAVMGEDGEQTKVPIELWLDFESMRSRRLYYNSGFEDNKRAIELSEDIVGGGYMMSINHTKHMAGYQRMSEFSQWLTMYMNFDICCKQMFEMLKNLGDFTQQGDEIIDGVAYQVWEGEYSLPVAQAAIKVKSWFDPVRGNLGRFVMWAKIGDGEWRQGMDIEKVERNVTMPAATFEMVVPEGYELENTKETATEVGEMSFASASYEGLGVRLNISFTLGDGSVVICWKCDDPKDEGAIARAFEGLEIGGDLPELPVVVAGLRPMSKGGLGGEYVGKHLAYTHKDDSFYEWSIYVSNSEQRGDEAAMLYSVVTKINREDAKNNWDAQLYAPAGLTVDTGEKFERLVLGGMRHHNKGGTLPINMSYKDVLELTEQMRGSGAQ